MVNSLHNIRYSTLITLLMVSIQALRRCGGGRQPKSWDLGNYGALYIVLSCPCPE